MNGNATIVLIGHPIDGIAKSLRHCHAVKSFVLLSPSTHSFSLLVSFTIFSLSHTQLLPWTGWKCAEAGCDCLALSTLHCSENKCFLFSFFFLKIKERKVSVPLPGILRGRQRSVHWHFDHARKREASPIISSAALYGAIDLHPLCISAI